MKKYILTAIVVLACMVNAQTNPPKGTAWQSSSGRTSTRPNESVGQVYHAIGKERPDTKDHQYSTSPVEFNYTWGGPDKNPNQMWTYERTDIDTGWKYEGGTFEFTSNYVWTDFNSQFDLRDKDPLYKTEIQLGTITEFGYYKIDAEGNVISDAKAMMTTDATTGLQTEKSVIFENGDKIGLYAIVARGDETIAFTTTNVALDGVTNKTDSVETVNPNVDTGSRGLEQQYFCLFDHRGIDSYSHFEFYLAGTFASDNPDQTIDEFIQEVINNNPEVDPTTIMDNNGNAVSGQPLPGLLLSMVIGGTAVAFSKKRKKA